jgi:diguanylate cyclase (GGDEF)-like protein
LAYALDPSRSITQYVQSSWKSDAGLPQNSIHAIAQTTDGYLWLGTEEGLVRFDGIRFRVFSHRKFPGLVSDYIRALAAGTNGNLWIGTDSGLTHFTPSGGMPTPSDFQGVSEKDGLASNAILSLRMDREGGLWVGTLKGLNRIRNGRIENWSRGHGLSGSQINAIVQDRQGVLWVGATDGLSRLDHGQFVPLAFRVPASSEYITSLAAAPDGSLWIGTARNGLAHVSQGRAIAITQSLPGKEIGGLFVDRDGSLWIAFDRRGLGRMAGGRIELYNEARGLPSNRCSSAILEDREGNLWVGSIDAGLIQFRESRFVLFGKPEGLPGNYVANVLEAPDGSMWFGMDSSGVYRRKPDGSAEVWDHTRGLPNQPQYSIISTRDGSIWVGYRYGTLAHIQNGHVSVYADPKAGNSSLIAMLEDRDGNLWVAYYGKGVARFDHGAFHHITASGQVSQLVQAPDGALWIATDGDGLKRYASGVLTRFTTANGMPSDHVMCVIADPDGSIWTGTSSGGLSLIRNGRVVYTWGPRQGLSSVTVGSLLDDGRGNLWIGSDDGIFRVARSELQQTLGLPNSQIHPAIYGLKDGLRSIETIYGTSPATWRDHAGRLWFATIRGAAMIDPAHNIKSPAPPPVWIEQMLFDSKPVRLGGNPTLGPGSGKLEIEFTAPTFVAPQQVRFRYRLTSFDKDWVEAGERRTAYYTNLPPGHYTFEVLAASSDGVWSRAIASQAMNIRRPLFLSWGALAFYLALLGLALWGAIALRTRHLTRRQRELNRIVAERTAQLEKEKASLVEARNQLQILATHDSLTGLFNRGAMLEHLEREISRALRDRTTLGVLMADLDHFKYVNDQYGHLCGDEVLCETAARLRAAMRGYDVAGRFGGEEFLVLFPDFNLHLTPFRVDSLLDAIRIRPFQTAQGQIAITCSVGIGTFQPNHDPADPLSVIGRADEALYAAKHSGRNCARFEARDHNAPIHPEDSAQL